MKGLFGFVLENKYYIIFSKKYLNPEQLGNNLLYEIKKNIIENSLDVWKTQLKNISVLTYDIVPTDEQIKKIEQYYDFLNIELCDTNELQSYIDTLKIIKQGLNTFGNFNETLKYSFEENILTEQKKYETKIQKGKNILKEIDVVIMMKSSVWKKILYPLHESFELVLNSGFLLNIAENWKNPKWLEYNFIVDFDNNIFKYGKFGNFTEHKLKIESLPHHLKI